MGFDPSAFPPIADAGSLQREAAKFKSKADRVEELAADSFAAWSGMAGVYEAPEAPIVYGAFAPVRTSGQELAADARTLNSAVETYAAEAESIKSRYETLISRWHAIEAQKASDDEWREDEDLVQEDNDILSDANSLMAEYMAAQRACANKISSIYSGSSYVPTTQEGAGAGEVQFGFTGGQLNAAAAEGKLPWGEPTEWDAPWYRDTWDVVASFGKGAWSGVTGTVTGLWNMVNVTDWDTFSTTWKGIGTLAMDVAVVSSPGLLMSDPQRVMESQQRLIAVGKAAVHWDEWQEDPAYAAGATTFDLAAILATAGVGAATKAGSTASKIAAVSGAASKTGIAVRVTGLGAAARTTVKVADLATDLKIKSLDLSTTVARESLGRLAPVATRMDDAVEALRGPVPAYAGVGSTGARPFSDAVEAGMSRMDSRSDSSGIGSPVGDAAGPGSGSNAPSDAGESSRSGGGVAVGDAAPDGRSPDNNSADVPGQRIDPAYSHPETSHGTPVPDDFSDADAAAEYGSHREGGPTQMEGKGAYPERIDPSLAPIVDPDQPKWGVDEHGTPLTEPEYANRYGQVNDDTGLVEYDNLPDNAGAVPDSIRHYGTLDSLLKDFPGLELDRIGLYSGKYISVSGTPWHMRSMPVSSLGKELHTFTLNDLPPGAKVEVSEIAPAFGRPGGGTQIRILNEDDRPMTINELLDPDSGDLPTLVETGS